MTANSERFERSCQGDPANVRGDVPVYYHPCTACVLTTGGVLTPPADAGTAQSVSDSAAN